MKENRKEILEKELRKVGISNLISVEDGFGFTVPTISGKELHVVAELTSDTLVMVSYITRGDGVEESLMSEIGHFCHIVNREVHLGMLELNYNTGDVFARISVPFAKILPENDVYKRIIQHSAYLYDEYHEGIIGLINGKYQDAKEAFKDSYLSILKGLTKDDMSFLLDKIIKKNIEDDNT